MLMDPVIVVIYYYDHGDDEVLSVGSQRASLRLNL